MNLQTLYAQTLQALDNVKALVRDGKASRRELNAQREEARALREQIIWLWGEDTAELVEKSVV